MLRDDAVTRATLVLIGGTLLGRLLGFMRDALLARRFGLSADLDALIASLALGDLLTYLLLGTATAAAIVPYLAATAQGGGEERFVSEARSLLDSALVFFCILGIVAALAAAPLMKLLAPGLSPESAGLATSLSRVAMIGVVLTGVTLVQAPILQARGRFAVTAVATAIYNATVVLGLATLWRVATPQVVVLVTIVATGARFLAHDIQLRSAGIRWWPLRSVWQLGAIRAVSIAMPAALAVSLTDIGILVDRHFASQLGEGALSSVTLADKLVALPLGILAGSVATASLPLLSALRPDASAFRQETRRAMIRATGLTLPAVAAFASLHDLLVKLAYGGGSFNPSQIERTGGALQIYSLGLPIAAAGLVLSRAAFAQGSAWIAPIAAGCGLTMRAGWQAWFVQRRESDVRGIATGAVVGLTVQAVVLLVWYSAATRARVAPARS